MMLVLLFRVLPMCLPLLAGGRCLPVVSTPPLFPPSLASSLGLPNEFVLLLPPLWSPFPACLCCLDWVGPVALTILFCVSYFLFIYCLLLMVRLLSPGALVVGRIVSGELLLLLVR